jgi:O-antigen/teichoic acid export membrane protein
MRKFLLKISALTIFLVIAGWALFQWVFPEWYVPVIPWLVLLFYLYTLISHSVQTKAIGKGFTRFAQVNMIFTIVRLFLFSAVIVVYLIFNRDNVAGFISVTVLLYIIYTLFETRELTRYSRQNSGRSK